MELLKAWILAFFFQELMPTKPILAMLGQPGAGKTTAIRRILRILEDPDADVLGVQTDKQDAFRASIESHRLLVMDNLEKSGAGWMVDTLNKLATGGNTELRELYKTNSKHLIVPRCFVAVTAVNLPFNDETLFSRLLVLEMQRVSDPAPEFYLQRKIRENEGAIWADLLKKLDQVVASIKKNRSVRPPTKSRLVDFTVFCERIKDSGVVRNEILSMGLLAMVDSQMKQLKESSQAIQLLETWIQRRPVDAGKWHTYRQIYDIFAQECSMRKIDLKWKSPQGLERHLSTLKDRLRADFSAEYKIDKDYSGAEVEQVRFQPLMIEVDNAPVEIDLARSGAKPI
jgi:predicted Ser/Thr protein kinase